MNIHLGQMHAHSFATDPKHLGFVLARYHFVARMLQGAGSVLEVGCGDMTGAAIVRKAVGAYFGTDRDDSYNPFGNRDFAVHDMLDGPVDKNFDAAFALDVLEHVRAVDEDRFLRNICASINPHGTVIIGMPSLESQPYASELSRRHHVNCKTAQQMRETLGRHFHNVYLFGMQDMTLHVGFDQMCHYRIAVCTGKRSGG